MRLNHSPTDADLQPACCCNSQVKLSTNTATLFVADPIRSCIDTVIHIFPTPLFPFVHPLFFSSAPFDE